MITAKAARVNRGYSQEECAKGVNISRCMYIKYENGVVSPSLPIARKIADFLDVDLDDIVFLPKI